MQQVGTVRELPERRLRPALPGLIRAGIPPRSHRDQAGYGAPSRFRAVRRTPSPRTGRAGTAIAASGADSAGTGESPFIGLKPRQQQRSTSRAPLRLIAMGARRAHPGLAGGQMRRTPPQPYGPAAKPTARTQVPRQPDSVGYQRFSRPAPMPDKPATPSNSQVQSADLSACSQVE